MPKLLKYTSYFAVAIGIIGIILYIFLNSQNKKSINIVEEKKDTPTEETTSTPYKQEIENLIPKQATDIEIKYIDLDGDDTDEAVLHYFDPKVVVRKGETRKIEYIKVYKLIDNSWILLKEDEATNTGGNIDTKFCTIEVVNLGEDNTEELLTSKCETQRPRTTGYIIFGLQADGNIGEYIIPKAYLNESTYLKKGDTALNFENVTVETKGIVEYYKVACASRNQLGARKGDESGGYCRILEIYIPFDSATKKFGIPIIKKDEITIPSTKIKIQNNPEIYITLPLFITLDTKNTFTTQSGGTIELKHNGDENPGALDHILITYSEDIDTIKNVLPEDLSEFNFTYDDLQRIPNTYSQTELCSMVGKLKEYTCNLSSGNINITNKLKEKLHTQTIIKIQKNTPKYITVTTFMDREPNYYDLEVSTQITKTLEIK